MIHRRLSHVSLDTAINDPSDRTVMPMQTIITIDADPPNPLWLAEAPFVDGRIGDIQLFQNTNCHPQSGKPMQDKGGKDLPAAWKWWGGIPCAKIKNYRFSKEEIESIQPETVAEPVPFELPKTTTNAEREEKPRKAREEGSVQPR
jgi:hypothetical protein